MMDIPAEARAMGARPSWIGYIWVEDVDKALPKLTAAGGAVFKPPSDIPGVGRFAVVADPDGAALHAVPRRGRQSAAGSAARNAGPRRLA